MKVFISHSGDRSRSVAEALKGFIENALQACEVWLSSESLRSGVRWPAELSEALRQGGFGIACVTPENQEAPWLVYEAGALSRTVPDDRFCPFLLGMKPIDLRKPLADFQAEEATAEGTRRLLASLNQSLPASRRTEAQLAAAFDAYWPALDAALRSIPSTRPRAKPARDVTDMMSEALQMLRELVRSKDDGPLLPHPQFRHSVRLRSSSALADAIESYAKRGKPSSLIVLGADIDPTTASAELSRQLNAPVDITSFRGAAALRVPLGHEEALELALAVLPGSDAVQAVMPEATAVY